MSGAFEKIAACGSSYIDRVQTRFCRSCRRFGPRSDDLLILLQPQPSAKPCTRTFTNDKEAVKCQLLQKSPKMGKS